MRVFLRYLALQASGWVLAALLLSGLVYADFLPYWVAVVLVAALVIKDLLFFPYVRRAYEVGVPHGAGELMGLAGEVEESLTPDGYLRVGSERWRARLVGKVRSLPVGASAIIRDIDNLTLLVEPLEDERSEARPDSK